MSKKNERIVEERIVERSTCFECIESGERAGECLANVSSPGKVVGECRANVSSPTHFPKKSILASTRIRQTGEFLASTRIRQIRRRVAIA